MAEDEHRDKRRQRVFEGVTILTGMTNSEVTCTVNAKVEAQLAIARAMIRAGRLI